MIQNVLIIGAGAIGRTIGGLIQPNVKTVSFWDIDLTKVPQQGSLDDLTSEADAVFLCVPSWNIREVATKIEAVLKRGTPVVSLAKGIEEDSLKTMAGVLKEVLLKSNPRVILSGPMLAKELNQGISSRAVLAADDEKTFESLAALFENSILQVEYSPAIEGVALAGVLKNIYAIAFGLADGLKLGDNFEGCLMTGSLAEMQKIFTLLNQDKNTALGLAGLGDLVATGFSEHSRNRTFGYELAMGRRRTKSEGTVALASIKKLLENKTEALPLLNLLTQIVLEEANPREAFSKFLKEKKS